MTMYKHRAPSTTSLSDNDDDDLHGKSIYADNDSHLPIVSPAQWSTKLRLAPFTHPSSHKSCPISLLPPEVLIHILKHLHSTRDLYSALRVSRTWCECSVELLWHKPTFSKYDTLDKMIRLFVRTDQTFSYATFIRRLNFLTLAKDIKDDVLSVLARCERLERLTLVNCDGVSGETLSLVLPKFTNLVAIDLSGVVHTSNMAIVGLASAARRLQGINLAGCKRVSDEGVMALAAHCPLLRRVKLSYLELLTDAPVSALAKSCPLLLEIDLNHCSLITDIAARDIWAYSTHMREMRLSHCPALTDTAFPSPRKRDYVNPQDANSPFPQSMKPDDLPPLILNRSFEHLRMLDLTACALVTDEAIEGIITHAPKIRNLVLSKCSLLTDRSVENICKLGRHLHYLHLGHAVKITDRSVRNLARNCTRLRYIDFANCALLTDMSVFELSSLPKLRRIGLVRVANLTDEAIYALADRHATLERIHLSYCDQISVMAIHFLLQKLHKLTHLSLTGVPAFRQRELQQFCREPPQDFNSAQQQQFCVYSGRGVSQLRAFLTELFDHITELNGTDDTEYEDDDTDVFHEDETPEPDGDHAEADEDEDDTASRRPYELPSSITFRHDGRRQAHGHAQGYATLPSTGLHDIAFPPTHGVSDLNNTQAIANRLSPQYASPRPSIPEQHGSVVRTIADMFPIVESAHSTPSSDETSNQSRGSSRAPVFSPPREDIESHTAFSHDVHGPSSGTYDHNMVRGQEYIPHCRPLIDNTHHGLYPSQYIVSNEHPIAGPSRIQSHTQETSGSSTVVWPYREAPSPSPELQEPSDSRGRNVRRSLRNTLNAAEQYASTFLFGRSPHRQSS